MPTPSFPLISWIDDRWPGARKRALPIALALALELLLLLVLLTLGTRAGVDRPRGDIVSTFDVTAPAERPASEPQAATAPPPSQAPPTEAPATRPAKPSPLSLPPAVLLPRPQTTPQPSPSSPAATASPATTAPKITAVIRGDMATVRGPQGAAGAPGDSRRLTSTGPHGEPLYAAQWYREPTHDELTGYLDYVNPPAWALIDCQTVPDFKVDHCVLIDEWPDGANMGRAVLAAAWQFKVRPPRIGGRVMVGEWVRIRIDYDVKRK